MSSWYYCKYNPNIKTKLSQESCTRTVEMLPFFVRFQVMVIDFSQYCQKERLTWTAQYLAGWFPVQPMVYQMPLSSSHGSSLTPRSAPQTLYADDISIRTN
jgi:hypothetical protein